MYKFEMSTQNNQTQVAVPCKQISSIKFGEWREREREQNIIKIFALIPLKA